jgi:DNA replication protein DnaC
MTAQAELAHLFRTLKAPAAARALPKLAERARQEEWSYERFAEALLATEVASRDAHGGASRIKQARFPARKLKARMDRQVSLNHAFVAAAKAAERCRREAWVMPGDVVRAARGHVV